MEVRLEWLEAEPRKSERPKRGPPALPHAGRGKPPPLPAQAAKPRRAHPPPLPREEPSDEVAPRSRPRKR